ncbi:MAG: type II toxin-antitoxin system VapC family toxin [Spirochaetota bacterium]
MIVLDTNVLSEIMKPVPEPRVVDWVDSVPAFETAITSVTVAEILYGVGRMPEGKRRRQLLSAAEAIFEEDFRDRVLVFDADAAVEYATLALQREAAGLPISMADAQIASVCRVHECTLATRNDRDFEGTGVRIVNPWIDGRMGRDEESRGSERKD